jgi:hypothetical protein
MIVMLQKKSRDIVAGPGRMSLLAPASAAACRAIFTVPSSSGRRPGRSAVLRIDAQAPAVRVDDASARFLRANRAHGSSENLVECALGVDAISMARRAAAG